MATLDELKTQIDEMSEDDKEALRAHLAVKKVEAPPAEEKDAEESVSFAALDAMVSAKFPDRDAFIARCLRERCSKDQVRARMDDYLIERATAKVTASAEEIAAAAAGGPAAMGGESATAGGESPKTWADAVAALEKQGKNRVEAVNEVNRLYPKLREQYVYGD